MDDKQGVSLGRVSADPETREGRGHPLPTAEKSRQPHIMGALLVFLPLISFVAQYFFSIRAGTSDIMLHHLTVTIVDWIFIPFNYFVMRVIDWRRGERLFQIASLSVGINILVNAYWQYNGIDFGHMITKTGIVLPAGWVHMVFSIIEMTLLVAFVFCRREDIRISKWVSLAAVSYFFTMLICGYLMHSGFILPDVIVFVCGTFFVLVYPGLRRRFSSSNPNASLS